MAWLLSALQLIREPCAPDAGHRIWGEHSTFVHQEHLRGGARGGGARAAVSYRTASYRNLSKHHRQPGLLLWAECHLAAQACSVPSWAHVHSATAKATPALPCPWDQEGLSPGRQRVPINHVWEDTERRPGWGGRKLKAFSLGAWETSTQPHLQKNTSSQLPWWVPPPGDKHLKPGL